LAGKEFILSRYRGVPLDAPQIAALLEPFLGGFSLSDRQLDNISTYINIVSLWNERTNLTAIRDPQEMVRRHFGESLFAAVQLLAPESTLRVLDIGSGAGFPGIPLRIFAPEIGLTLIESHGKKATFLREVSRALGWKDVEVFNGRAEAYTSQAELVTMRAVEKFESVLPVAASKVEAGGRLALFIGAAQLASAQELVPGAWEAAVPVPESSSRVLAVRLER
jgi:16S rRNA (guanine527-N7)-methyltransferase